MDAIKTFKESADVIWEELQRHGHHDTTAEVRIKLALELTQIAVQAKTAEMKPEPKAGA